MRENHYTSSVATAFGYIDSRYRDQNLCLARLEAMGRWEEGLPDVSGSFGDDETDSRHEIRSGSSSDVTLWQKHVIEERLRSIIREEKREGSGRR